MPQGVPGALAHRRPRALSISGSPAAPAQEPAALSLHSVQDLARDRGGRPEGVAGELDDMASPKLSRSGFTNPFGKLGKAINGLTLPTDVEEAIRARAHKAGLPFLEMLRERIVIAEMGRDAVEDAHRRRLDSIEGKQQE